MFLVTQALGPLLQCVCSLCANSNSLFYTVLLVPICGMSFYLGVTDLVTTLSVLAVSLWFAYKAYTFSRTFDRTSARKLLFSSFAYLPLVLIIILIGSIV